jgi:glucokinase
MRLRYAIGVEVGAKIAAAVVDSGGTIATKIKAPTDQRGPVESIRQVSDLVLQAAGGSGVALGEICAACIAVPGIHYAASGQVWAPNIPGGDHIPLRDELTGRLPVRVRLESDRAAYVIGEQWLGAAQGLRDVIFLAVGTGIGAGLERRTSNSRRG